jgi:hypothetical protein
LDESFIQKQDLFYFGIITSGHYLILGGHNLLFFILSTMKAGLTRKPDTLDRTDGADRSKQTNDDVSESRLVDLF